LTNTSRICTFLDLRSHRASSWNRCHISKLFFDEKWHRVTPDYAMTGRCKRHSELSTGNIWRRGWMCSNPYVLELWQLVICLSIGFSTQQNWLLYVSYIILRLLMAECMSVYIVCVLLKICMICVCGFVHVSTFSHTKPRYFCQTLMHDLGRTGPFILCLPFPVSRVLGSPLT
jgi:hypothetical protein